MFKKKQFFTNMSREFPKNMASNNNFNDSPFMQNKKIYCNIMLNFQNTFDFLIKFFENKNKVLPCQ